jgi:hypothetical protein
VTGLYLSNGEAPAPSGAAMGDVGNIGSLPIAPPTRPKVDAPVEPAVEEADDSPVATETEDAAVAQAPATRDQPERSSSDSARSPEPARATQEPAPAPDRAARVAEAPSSDPEPVAAAPARPEPAKPEPAAVEDDAVADIAEAEPEAPVEATVAAVTPIAVPTAPEPAGPRVVHRSLLDVRVPPRPEFPPSERDTEGVVCLATVNVSEKGVVTAVTVADCPLPFAQSTDKAMWKARFGPPVIEGQKMEVQTTVPVKFGK